MGGDDVDEADEDSDEDEDELDDDKMDDIDIWKLSVGAAVPVTPPIVTGTQLRRFSKALFISRILVRSLAFAVFLRYLLNGAAFVFGFSFTVFFVDLSFFIMMLLITELRCCLTRNEYFSLFLQSPRSSFSFMFLLMQFSSSLLFGSGSVCMGAILELSANCFFNLPVVPLPPPPPPPAIECRMLNRRSFEANKTNSL